MVKNSTQTCHYCQKIKNNEKNYPNRKANFTFEDIIYRCPWHAQFSCSKCSKSYHFSWLFWCSYKKEFICGNCIKPTMYPVKFWDWTYAYTIECPYCSEEHYDLLYTEFCGIHPWQTTKTIENDNKSVWKPFKERIGERIELKEALSLKNQTFELRKQIGSTILHSEYLPEEDVPYTETKRNWEKTSETWIEELKNLENKDQGDLNRQFIIDPVLWKQIGDVNGLKVLDVGCGNGYLTRELARRGAKAFGVDHSLIFTQYCIKQEEKERLGCTFYNSSIDDMKQFQDNSFDLVIANVVFIDVLHYKKAFKEISRVLKNKGSFIWSNIHPIFGKATNVMMRLPYDTMRNEERQYLLIDRYFDTGAIKLSWGKFRPIWQFDRTLTDYSIALRKAGFVIIEITEPKADNTTIIENPIQFAFDADRIPFFIIFNCMKLNTPQFI